MTHTWLVSSGGRRAALVKILQNTPEAAMSRVVVTDACQLTSAGRIADDFELVPPANDAVFISHMLMLSAKHKVDQIVPTIDPELPVYAGYREDFLQIGTDVMVSAPSVITLSHNKWEFYKWLTLKGFPTVKTLERSSFNAGDLRGPVVAKPRSGSSSIGVMPAASTNDLRLDRLTSDYIIQEQATGVEVTVDFAVAKNGKFLGAVPRRRIEARAGEVSKGVTVRIPELEDLVRQVAESLEGAYGILNIQVFINPLTRDVKIIELNARVGGGYPLSHQAGADLFSALAADDGRVVGAWKPGMVMLRYDDAVFFQSDELGVL